MSLMTVLNTVLYKNLYTTEKDLSRVHMILHYVSIDSLD